MLGSNVDPTRAANATISEAIAMSERAVNDHAITRRDAMRVLGTGAGLGVIASGLSASVASQSRGIVRTIVEDIPPARLTGITLFHEHLSTARPDGQPSFYEDTSLIADEVKACAADGVRCIVDAGTAGLGRKIEALRTIARRSGLFIVAGGGLHARSDYPADVFRKSADEVADRLVALANTERWGVIGEMGTGPAIPMDAEERKGLQAAAKAQVRTGLPIITHVSDGCLRCAMDQVDLFETAGADLGRVVIGHLNDIERDLAGATIAIAKRGANLGLDHSGRPDDPRLDEYVRTILAVLEAGFEDRIFLSSDFGNSKYLRKNGGPGIDVTVTLFAPRLRRAGVSEAVVRRILEDNPRRLLTFVPKTE
jgi:phosphotriesterase-related protein